MENEKHEVQQTNYKKIPKIPNYMHLPKPILGKQISYLLIIIFLYGSTNIYKVDITCNINQGKLTFT